MSGKISFPAEALIVRRRKIRRIANRSGGKLAASFEKISYAHVRVENRSKDDNFDRVDDLAAGMGVALVRVYCVPCPMIALNAGLTHPPQRVRWSRS